MKDMYSFHRDVTSLEEFYREAMEGYSRVFTRLGLSPSTQLDAKGRVAFTYASGGSFSRYSHEYQLITESGEDTIFVTPDGSVAFNEEVISDHDLIRSLYAGKVSELKEVRAIEIGNIFQLGTRFSQAVGMSVVNESGKAIHPVMGCYGIGVTRIMGALVEVFHDAKGIIWPHSIAPFDAHIILVSGASLSMEHAHEISRHLPHDWQVVVDDREKLRVGEKFADADLYGAPLRITVGLKYLEKGTIEIKKRDEEHGQEVSVIELCKHITTRRGS
jgi:prolyl-tRNA synthetase